MHDLCMATKTISLEIDAYERLRQARLDAKESFSSVVRRARWEETPRTAGRILAELQAAVKEHPGMLLPPEALGYLDQRKRTSRQRAR